MTDAAFTSLALNPLLLQSLAALGFTDMTPIQQQSLPPMLAGKDMLARAGTGTGKTAAFALALLNRLRPDDYRTQALVLCPTRELAEQVGKDIRALARCLPNIKLLSLCGGVPIGPQLGSLAQPPHIVVGTPGRVLDHLGRDSLRLDQLTVLVLDEADRMLDMGFEEDINRIVKCAPRQRQTLLFSATYPDTIQHMSQRLLRQPVEISVTAAPDCGHIEQYAIEVPPADKPVAVARLLAARQPESTVVFCNTKADCANLCRHLETQGHSVLALHGDLEQRDREQVLLRFANQSCAVLIATDVAARGLDIKDLALVINYELAHDPEVHVHRIGRTGRAGSRGLAYSLCAPREAPRLVAIETYQQQPVTWQDYATLPTTNGVPRKPAMTTLCIEGGRKDKIRPTDILGALTGEGDIAGSEVGKIDVLDTRAYVAIRTASAVRALKRLQAGQIKGRRFRASRVG